MAIKLIVGLRNPGSSYQPTRHNAGAWFIENLLNHYSLNLTLHKKMQADIGSFNAPFLNEPCLIALPTVFMNQSGITVRSISQFFRINPDEILIAHDDLDLESGRIKLKTGGGHGGHNGLRDIIAQIGSPAFHRLRIGIGHPGDKSLVLNYVLGKPSVDDKEAITAAICRSIVSIPTLLSRGLDCAMNELNR